MGADAALARARALVTDRVTGLAAMLTAAAGQPTVAATGAAALDDEDAAPDPAAASGSATESLGALGDGGASALRIRPRKPP